MAFLFICFATAPYSSRHSLESLAPSHQPGKQADYLQTFASSFSLRNPSPEYHSSSAANYLLCLPSFPTPIYSGPHRSWSSNIFPPTQIFIPAPGFSRLSLGTLWPFLPGTEVWPVEKQECDLQIFTLSPHLHIPSLVSCLALQQTECSWILLTIWPHSQRSKQILKEHLALLSPVNSSRALL